MMSKSGGDQPDGVLARTLKEVEKKIGEMAKKAKEFAGEVQKKVDEAKKFYDDHKGDIEKIKDFIGAVKEAKDHGEKTFEIAQQLEGKLKEAFDKAKAKEWDAAKKIAEEAKPNV